MRPGLHEYAKESAKVVEQRKGAALSVRDKQLLVYLSYMLQLYEMKREIKGEPGALAEKWKVGEVVVRGLLAHFTVTSVDLRTEQPKHMKSKEMQHKLVHYIIVVALFIHDF